MFRNYLKTAWRNLAKNRLYASVNIAGLAIGIASFVVILIYLNYELSYDKWRPALKNVHKVGLQSNGDIMQGTPAPLADFLEQNHPNVEAATAIMPSGDFETLLTAGEKKIYQKGLVWADSSFLQVFPYELAAGNAATALNAPNAVILSEEVSRKLFGTADPIGKTIKIYNSIEGLVTAVLKKPEGPSHLHVEMIIRDPYETSNKFWENFSFQTYIKTKGLVAGTALEKSINHIFYNARLKEGKEDYETYKKNHPQTALFSDAVADLHNFPKHGDSRFKITLVLLVLSLFLLIAGAINFSNLSLARAITRAKEVGVRKVLGSRHAHIVFQSLVEIGMQCFISLLLALLLVQIALPYFRTNFDLPLSLFNRQTGLSIALQIAAGFLFIILVSGLYPAVFLSRYQTAEVLKGKYSKGKKGIFFRNSLLVVQLTLSALFITGMIVINRQMTFMQQKDLGFNAARVLRIEAGQKTREEGFPQVKNTLLTVPGVAYVAKTTAVPGSKYIDTTTSEFRFAGTAVRLNSTKVSIDYFKTMDIKLLQGRLFADDHPEDLDNTAIINETALKKLGVANPIGQLLYFPYCDSIPYTVVGVVKDFNVQGLQTAVQPVVYSTSNAHCGYLSAGAILVKINTGHVQKTLAGIEAAWKTIEPDFPIRYSFLDQDFQQLFSEHIRLSKIILFFTIVSIVIAMIGLFALTSFLAQQRVKEIGIRKVLGASVQNITALLSKDFIRLAVIAILIAAPLSWWALHKWLEDFAYRISLSGWMFVLAGAATIALTVLTVSIQAIRSAIANPVKNLRTE